MPQLLTLAVAQARTLSSTAETLASLESITNIANQTHSADLILFPEAFLGGYPRTCTFGGAVGSRNDLGREQFLQYFHAAIDLGDTPQGAGDAWVQRRLPRAPGAEVRGDGTREELERIARETGVFVATGIIERAGGSLYCAVVYVCPRLGVIGKRRKVMPTGSERLIWAQGDPATLRAVVTTIKGVRLTLAAAICWENYMPLLRQSLYSQNVNLYLAPTADARDTWCSLMRTVACEGRTFVLSANQCVTRGNLPEWIRKSTQQPKKQQQQQQQKPSSVTNGEISLPSTPPIVKKSTRRRSSVWKTEDGHEVCWPTSPNSSMCTLKVDKVEAHHEVRQESTYFPEISGPPEISHKDSTNQKALNGDVLATTVRNNDGDLDDTEFMCRGGSCIISPLGEVLGGPLWEVEDGGLVVVQADFEDCERGRLDLDVAGSYSRSDAFKLTVTGLDLSPPP